MIRGRLSLVAILAISQACASKGDFQSVSGDVAAIRRRDAARDSLQSEELAQIISISRSVAAMSDSLRTMTARLVSATTMTDTQVETLKEEIARLQDVTGENQQHLTDLRAAMEGRRSSLPPVPDSTAAVSPGATGPGPAQLLQLGSDQMAKRSYTSARAALGDLLAKFPASDLAPEAAFEIAQSFAAEKNLRAADTSYARFASSYPSSAHAPTALYKRALILQSLGRKTDSRKILEGIVRRYPGSTEAGLAKERLGSARK